MKEKTTTLASIFNKTLLNKSFSKMGYEIRTILMSILFDVASNKDYLENNTSYADTIGYHLDKINIIDFRNIIDEYFITSLKRLKKLVDWNNITLAFDETFIPYYGKKTSLWIDAYNNKIKGAKGSYKFMCCSIVIGEKRYVFYAMPMRRGESCHNLVDRMLEQIKKRFRIKHVLCDRGFASKRMIITLEKYNLKYLILVPKRSDIKRFIKEKRLETVIETTANFDKIKFKVSMRYVFAYNFYKYNWAFLTNIKNHIFNIIHLYKRRWGIETTFRVMDFADIKSKSTNLTIRSFFFVISVLLYNMWIEQRSILKCTFKSFLQNIYLANIDLGVHIEKILTAKNQFNIPLTLQEKKLLEIVI